MSSGSSTYAETVRARERHASECASLALQRTTEALSRLGRAEDFIPEVLRIVAEAFGAKSCSFFENSNDTIWLRYWWHQGKLLGPTELPRVDPEHLGAIVRMAQGFTVPRSHLGVDAFTRAEPSLVEHRRLQGDPELQRFAISMGWDRELNVPLHVAGIACGALVIYRGEDRPFDAEDVALGSALARQLALALQVSRLVVGERERAAEAERRIGEEKRLAGLVKVHDALTRSLDSLASAPDIDEFLGEVLRIAAGQAGVELAHLWVHDADGWVTLRRGYCRGVAFSREQSARMPLAHVYAQPFRVPAAMIGGEPIFDRTRHLVQDILADEIVAQLIDQPTIDVYRKLGVQWELNVPLRFGGRCVAHLAVYLPTGREVTPDLVEMVHALGRQVTLAMELARLSAEARTAAVSRERVAAAAERTRLMEQAVSAMRRCSDSLLGVEEPRDAILAALRAMADALASLGVIDVGLLELALPARTLRVTALLRDGESQPIAEGVFDRDWPIDETPMSLPWKQLSAGAPFVWGLTSDTSVLVPDTRAFHEAMGALAVGYVPLERAGEPMGCIGLSFREPLPPSEHQISLVRALTTHVFLAIELERIANQSREVALAKERVGAAAQRARLMEQALSAIRRCSESLDRVTDSAIVMRHVMRAAGEVLAPAGVIDVGFVEYLPSTRSVCIRAILRNGEELPLGEIDFSSRQWSIDDAGLAVPWSRIQRGAFIWGEVTDPSVLHPDARAFHLSSGAKSIAYQPIARGGEILGWLAFVLASESEPDADLVGLLRILASQIVQALEFERIAKQSQEWALSKEREEALVRDLAQEEKARAALQEMVDIVSSLPTLDAFVPAALGIVARTFGVGDCSYYDALPDEPIRLRFWEREGRSLMGEELATVMPHRPELIAVLQAGFEVPDSYFGVNNRERTRAFTLDHQRGTSVPEFDAWAVENGFGSELNVPLVASGQMIGALVIYRPAGATFEPSEVALAERLGKQLALAVATARLAEEAREAAVAREREAAASARADELAAANAALRKTAARLAEAADIDEALKEALRNAANAVDGVGGALGVYIPEERGFRNRFQILDGEVQNAHADRLYSLDEPEMARAWEAFLSPDCVLWCPPDSHYLTADTRDYVRAQGFSGAVLTPILRGRTCIGYLGFFSRAEEAPKPVKRELVRSLADQIALMLEMSRLGEEARGAAVLREREAAAEAHAAELLRANEALRRREALLVATNEATRILLETGDDLASALSTAFGHIAKAAGMDRLLVLVQKPASNGIGDSHYVYTEYGVPGVSTHAALGLIEQRNDQFPSLVEALHAGRSYWIRTDDLDDEGRKNFVRLGVDNTAGVPIFVGGSYFGQCTFDYNKPTESLEPLEQDMLEITARAVAAAFERERVAAERAAVARERTAGALRRADELQLANSALRRAIEGLSRLDDVRAFLDALLEACIEVAGAHSGTFAVLIPEGVNQIVLRDPNGAVSLEQSIAERTAILPWTPSIEALCQKIVHEELLDWSVPPDDEPNPDSMLAFHARNGSRSIRCVPMLVGAKLIGWLGLGFADLEPDTAKEVSLLRVLADQATTAVEMARLAGIAQNAAITEERNRMAGEIHDSLAQSFTSIALQSESLLSGLDPESSLRGTLGIIEKTARRGLAEARTSVLVLQPVKEAVGELELALKELAERSNIPGSIACEFRTRTEPCALSTDVRSAVLRVAQEAVSNALRHSGARKIVVNFDVHDGEATLTITDDGRGLREREPERRGGLGIPGMRARAESLGGALTVFAGTERHGTTVRMRVDCHAAKATHP